LIENSKLLISHPTGNTFVRALLQECEKQDLLAKFFTTVGKGENSNYLLKKILNRRSYTIPDEKVCSQWFPEIWRLLLGKYKSQEKRKYETDRSYELLDKKVSKNLDKLNISSIHAYEDGAAHTFSRAKELGIRCSYELPIAHWGTVRRLLAEEAERYPEWIPTLDSIDENEEKLHRKELELELADCISCPSEFVLQSIPKSILNSKPCQVSNFGSPFSQNNSTIRLENKKILKILFVGSMTQRKGLADLFTALRILKTDKLSLTIIGQPLKPINFYRNQCYDFEHIRSCSNEKVKSTMREHDILVLPSIVEGCALVQQEALSCGLPLLITRNTGGEELIDNQKTGFIVPIREPNMIAEKIEWFIDNIEDIHLMKSYCIKKSKDYSWSKYAQNLISFLNNQQEY
jgi:glycosyltransferase involved in cell wall biosynthesis